MNGQSSCPCTSGLLFHKCCGEVIKDHRLAMSAERLMRSRYVAYVIKAEDYLLSSWHPTTRPNKIDFEPRPVRWLGLEIHGSELGRDSDSKGSVDFTATYYENGQICKLREKSHFVKEHGLWYYLSGKCEIAKEKPARNSACPCGSGRKFKRCCLRR
ncbi:MAG: YchJ family protein [Desulforhopalus sp.]